MEKNIEFDNVFWVWIIVLTIMMFALLLVPVSYDIYGKWTGDIQVNKADPHYGVWFMGSELDKSTSLQITGLQFHIKGSMPAYMVDKILRGK